MAGPEIIVFIGHGEIKSTITESTSPCKHNTMYEIPFQFQLNRVLNAQNVTHLIPARKKTHDACWYRYQRWWTLLHDAKNKNNYLSTRYQFFCIFNEIVEASILYFWRNANIVHRWKIARARKQVVFPHFSFFEFSSISSLKKFPWIFICVNFQKFCLFGE